MTDRVVTLKESDALRAMPALNPQALIAAAIEKSASVETLERLVTLAKDVRAVTAREAWYEAMAQFQRQCPKITKDSTANIPTRSGGSFKYSYAALDTILAVVQPLLGELGLSVSWRQKHEANAVQASCVVAHRLGHQEESGFIAMPYSNDGGRMNPAQAVGSALTYARRYSLLAILGLAPEDDDDAGRTATVTEPTRGATPHGPSSHDGARTEPPAREPIPDAELVQESDTLFQKPEEDRVYLIAEIKKLGKTIPAGDKAEAAITYGIGATLEATDTAALSDLLKWMQARAKK